MNIFKVFIVTIIFNSLHSLFFFLFSPIYINLSIKKKLHIRPHLCSLVRRMQSDDKDGSSCSFSTATSSPSCVESDMIERNEMVTVNKNCVNIDYASNIDSNKMKNIINNDDDNNNNNNEKENVNSILLAATALDEFDRQLNDSLTTSLAIEKNQNDIDDENLSQFNNLIHDGDNENHGNVNDDDATSSSKYSDVMCNRRCEMSSTSALSHVAHYTPTPDNNRNHRKAVRKNFSLWIGVTSCVWACLVWLMKSYA